MRTRVLWLVVFGVASGCSGGSGWQPAGQADTCTSNAHCHRDVVGTAVCDDGYVWRSDPGSSASRCVAESSCAGTSCDAGVDGANVSGSSGGAGAPIGGQGGEGTAGNAPAREDSGAAGQGSAGSGGACIDVFTDEPCGNCMEEKCCPQLTVCAESSSCAACVHDPSGSECFSNQEFLAVADCSAALGGPCVTTCDLSYKCENAAPYKCDLCVAINCCAERAACEGDISCVNCVQEKETNCKNANFVAMGTCVSKSCYSECMSGTCGQKGSVCVDSPDCCSKVCDKGRCTECVVSCAGKTCGEDGCGGVCGICGGNKVCEEGQCE